MSQEYPDRNPAVRLLAGEINKSDYRFKESDKERAPNYLLLPSGGKANRIAVGGTLISVDDVSGGGTDSAYWRAKIDDPTGTVNAYAGEYQPEAADQLSTLSNDETVPPALVTVVGKTAEYRPEDDEGNVIINVNVESISVVDHNEHDNWLYEATEATIDRLEQDEGEYVEQAEARYGNRFDLLQEDVQEALESLE